MKIDGKYQDKIPNGFRSILQPDTKLLNKTIEGNTIILNFNKKILDVKKEEEERIIEAIIYNMTEVKDITSVQIKIEGQILTKLPKSGKKLNDNLSIFFPNNNSSK